MKKGFTIIELLVVITIISVLASVILPRLGTVREKGADALLKTNVSSVSSQAAIVREDDGDYAAVCTDAAVINALEVASEKTTGATTNYVCYDEASGWAASVPLAEENLFDASSGVDYWCIEEGASAVLRDTQIAADAITCS